METQAADKRMLEREALRSMIQQWNANRLDLFELSEPNENLEFHGVMRFYFQDSGQKIATKCIRVASDATVSDVIETLIEKFRPDMRMLSLGSYVLYEVHAPHEERRLAAGEKPLLVQLNWHADDREGRFLLRCQDHNGMPLGGTADTSNQNFKRKLSKREKKELKKKEKLSRLKSDATNDENRPAAEKLYTELPETSFTRSISNPEAVMRRRRQQKLERKLQQFRSKDGGPDTGGTLKIYGESLCPDVPYKTLLVAVGDCAAAVVREMLDKYGLRADPHHYCLVQVNMQDNSEYILDDDECPLAIVMTHPHRGSIMFHVRRRPADCQPRRRKKKAGGGGATLRPGNEPLLLETTPDGAPLDNGRRVRLNDVVEVGSGNGTTLQLYGPSIQPRHCVVASVDGGVAVTPLHTDAHVYVDGQRVQHTQLLQHGSLVKFGRVSTFRFIDPAQENKLSRNFSQSQHFDSASVYDRSPTSPIPDNASGVISQASPSIHSQMDSTNGNTTGNTDYQRTMSPISTNTINNDTFNNYNNKDLSDSLSPLNNNTLKLDNESAMLSPHADECKEDAMRDENLGSAYNDRDTQSDHQHQQQTATLNRATNNQFKDNYETTFDLEGNVETKSICSAKSGGSGQENRVAGNANLARGSGQEAILPAVLEFPEHGQQQFLAAVVSRLDVHAPSFKLAPVYTLYLCARYRASTHYRPELTPTERAHKLTTLMHHVANLIHTTVQDKYPDAAAQAFWMANSSELLHFLKCDRHVCSFSTHAQERLAAAVQAAFSNLVTCYQSELSAALLCLGGAAGSDADLEAAVAPTLHILAASMALLRVCRVNAALTIQLFSHLFHYINAWCFNKLMSDPSLCTSRWGRVLGSRVGAVGAWAERQGLEVSADCHLARVHQAAHLLQAPKNTAEEMSVAVGACFKLNSAQVAQLLSAWRGDTGNGLAPELLDLAVRRARAVADELYKSDGREITLEENPSLGVSLLIPGDGFSGEVVRGVPPGLADFLAPLQRAGLCRLAAQPHSQGNWTVYMNGYHGSGVAVRRAQEPQVQVIQLHKNSNGMGLSIVAAKGAGQSRLGIYIKSVVAGGAAAADGRLQAGDQLLSVDGHSLVGITQEKAAEFLVRTGPSVALEVAKQGAVLHGLATLLQQPSPRAHTGEASAVETETERRARRNSGTFINFNPAHLQRTRPNSELVTSYSRPAESAYALRDARATGFSNRKPLHSLVNKQFSLLREDSIRSSSDDSLTSRNNCYHNCSIPRLTSSLDRENSQFYDELSPDTPGYNDYREFNYCQSAGPRPIPIFTFTCDDVDDEKSREDTNSNNIDINFNYEQNHKSHDKIYPQQTSLHFKTNTFSVNKNPNLNFSLNESKYCQSSIRPSYDMNQSPGDNLEYNQQKCKCEEQSTSDSGEGINIDNLPPQMENIIPKINYQSHSDSNLIDITNKKTHENKWQRVQHDEDDDIPFIDDNNSEPIIFESKICKTENLCNWTSGDSKARRILPALSVDEAEESNGFSNHLTGVTMVDATCQTYSHGRGKCSSHESLIGSLDGSDCSISDSQKSSYTESNNSSMRSGEGEVHYVQVKLDTHSSSDKEEYSQIVGPPFVKINKWNETNIMQSSNNTENKCNSTHPSNDFEKALRFEASKSLIDSQYTDQSKVHIKHKVGYQNIGSKEILDSESQKSWNSPDDPELSAGKVKALAKHFNSINLTYRARGCRRNCQSSPNLYEDSNKIIKAKERLTGSTSLSDISSDKLDHSSASKSNKLSQAEVNKIFIQLEDWSKYGTRGSIDTLTHDSQFDFSNLPSEEHSESHDNSSSINIVFREIVERKPKKITLDSIELPSTPVRFNPESGRENNTRKVLMKYGSLEKLTGLITPRIVEVIPRKTYSSNDVAQATQQRVTPVIEKLKLKLPSKFPDSYIVRKKSIMTPIRTSNLKKTESPMNIVLQSCPNLLKNNSIRKNIRFFGGSTHHSCPNLIKQKMSRAIGPSQLKIRRLRQRDISIVKDYSTHPCIVHMERPKYSGLSKSADDLSPRRASERDLPSRVQAEGAHVKPSKSVPTLHEPARHHDIFNPGYSRTSSSNSIPTLAGAKSKSSHNLSSPLSPSSDQGFYQNVGVARHAHNLLGDRSSTLRSSQNALQLSGGVARPQSAHYAAAPAPAPAPVPAPSSPPPSLRAAHSARDLAAAPHNATTSHLHHTQMGGVGAYPSMPNVSAEAGNAGNAGLSLLRAAGQHSLRGQAKLQEMQEEVLRRHQRATQQNNLHNRYEHEHEHEHEHSIQQGGYSRSNGAMSPTSNYVVSPSSAISTHVMSPNSAKHQPPVAPKPQSARRALSGELEMPLLPPAQTHPHKQPHTNSEDELGSVAVAQQGPGQGPSGNPWQREEREREAEARVRSARARRDAAIAALVALGGARTPQQHQQLRALQLERDFQRRAADHLQDDDDCLPAPASSSLVTSLTPVSVASSARPPHDDPPPTAPPPLPPQPKSILKSTPGPPHPPLSPHTPNSPPKAPKSATFSPTSTLADEREQIHRHDRQEQNIMSQFDPNVPMYGERYQPRELNLANMQGLSKYDPNIPTEEMQERMLHDIANMHITSDARYEYSQNRSREEDPAIAPATAPPPPERGSSFAVMSHAQSLQSNLSTLSLRDKRVSFHDRDLQQSNDSDNTHTQREDPDRFIAEAESMLQSPTTPTTPTMPLGHAHTPGVIGAQEVYRDPRTRRLLEQQRAAQASGEPIPEKLSFKEKMKMFALESGEGNTPKDKVKISRAQRDIDAVH